jgi:hypothetical protein
MPNFLERFGQRKENGEPYFSDVRSGLIVALVCPTYMLTYHLANLFSSQSAL